MADMSKLYAVVGAKTDGFTKGMNGVGKQLDTTQGKFGSFGKKAGIAMGVGIGALAGLAVQATKTAVEFEGSMRNVNTMMGLTEDEFKSLSDEVLNLSKTVGVSGEDLAGALYQVVSAGVPAGEAMDVLAVAASAAVGGMTSAETAVDGITTVLNAFKMESSEASHVADIMFTAVKRGKTTFEELSSSMAQVAPMAAAVGWSFEDVAGAVATMTKQGVPTTQAMTQLRQVIVSLLKPTADAQLIMDKYSLSLYNDTAESLKAKVAIADVNTKLQEQTARAQAANAAIEPLKASVEVANQRFAAQSQELDKLRAAYQNATYAISDMTSEMDFLSDQQAVIRLEIRKMRFAAAEQDRELTEQEIANMEALEVQLERLGIGYDELAIKRDDMQEDHQMEANVLGEAEKGNKRLADAVGLAAQAVTDAEGAYQAELMSIKDIEAALVAAQAAYTESSKELKTLPEIIDAINKAEISGADVAKLMGSVEAASAVMALAGKNAGVFADDLTAMYDSAGAATEAFDEINKGLGQQMKKTQMSFDAFMTQLGNALMPILKMLIDILNELIDALPIDELVTLITSALGPLISIVGKLVKTVLPPLISVLTDLLVPVFKMLAGVIGPIVSKLLPPLVRIITSLLAILTPLITTALEPIIALLGVWIDLLAPLLEILADLIEMAVKPLTTAITWLSDKALKPVIGWFQKLGDIAASILGSIRKGFENFREKIGSVFGRIKDILLAPFRAMRDIAEKAINWIIRKLNTLSWTVPDWVPFVGGKTFGFNIPEIHLPEFKLGGIVPGLLGQAVPIMAHAGEMIIPPDLVGALATVGGRGDINIYVQSMVVREEADVRKLGIEFRREYDRAARLKGIS